MNRFRLWGGWFVLPVIAGAWLGQPNARADDDRITIKLEYAKSIFGGAQPSGVEPLAGAAQSRSGVPTAHGERRLFGQIKLGKMNTVNVVLDVLENDEVAMVLTADDDVRFDDKADYRDEDKWQTRIRYADGAEQPYAIRPYYSVAFAKRVGKFRLNFHTACERVGPIKMKENWRR